MEHKSRCQMIASYRPVILEVSIDILIITHLQGFKLCDYICGVGKCILTWP